MKHFIVLALVLTALALPGWSQQNDSTTKKKNLRKYESELFKSLVDAELVSLSLVSPTLYNNWDTQLKIFKKKYSSQNALLLVSKADSRQKTEFAIEFMKLRTMGKDLVIAYAEALKTVTVKYLDLDFKHHLHLKE
ncbi:hypothetical protein BKI52_29300 [marine bacterium AO1-C]|nr:hypothetical protein BKI52_29300 [marine bacterium AO1-C]